MPTPRQLERIYREQALAAQGDFVVNEVVECVSEDEEGFGEEDIKESAKINEPVQTDISKTQDEDDEDDEEDTAAKLESMALHAKQGNTKQGVSLGDLTEAEQGIFLQTVAGGSKPESKKAKGKTHKEEQQQESNSCGRGAGKRPS
jgi:hypothetical protein